MNAENETASPQAGIGASRPGSDRISRPSRSCPTRCRITRSRRSRSSTARAATAYRPTRSRCLYRRTARYRRQGQHRLTCAPYRPLAGQDFCRAHAQRNRARDGPVHDHRCRVGGKVPTEPAVDFNLDPKEEHPLVYGAQHAWLAQRAGELLSDDAALLKKYPSGAAPPIRRQIQNEV